MLNAFSDLLQTLKPIRWCKYRPHGFGLYKWLLKFTSHVHQKSHLVGAKCSERPPCEVHLEILHHTLCPLCVLQSLQFSKADGYVVHNGIFMNLRLTVTSDTWLWSWQNIRLNLFFISSDRVNNLIFQTCRETYWRKTLMKRRTFSCKSTFPFC